MAICQQCGYSNMDGISECALCHKTLEKSDIEMTPEQLASYRITYMEAFQWAWRHSSKDPNFAADFYDRFQINPIWGTISVAVGLLFASLLIIHFVHVLHAPQQPRAYIVYIIFFTINAGVLFLVVQSAIIWLVSHVNLARMINRCRA